MEIKELYGDSAFSVWEVIEKYEGIDFVTKVVDSMNPDGLYTKDDFVIDPVEGTVRCPEGYEMKYDVELTRQRKETKVLFPRRYCGSCPQKERCTKSKRGRQITIHPYEDRLQQQRQYQRTQEFRERYAKRSHGERTIAHLTRHGARKATISWTEKSAVANGDGGDKQQCEGADGSQVTVGVGNLRQKSRSILHRPRFEVRHY